MTKYGFQLEEEVTVDPVTTKGGRPVKDGVVAKRLRATTSTGDKVNLYHVLYGDDSAETLIHEHRIHPKGQGALV